MKKLTTSLIALVLAAGSVQAEAPRPAPRDTNIARAVMFDATRAGSRVVAVGEQGGVLLTDDDGRTVRQARAVAADYTLTSVSFADQRNGWAVGHGGVILHTIDGGETWALQRHDPATDQPLLTVHFQDAQHGWAGGLWSLLLATSDGGATWRQVALPPPKGAKRADMNLLKIFSAPDGTLFIAAERGVVLRSRDGGTSWEYLQTGSNASLWSGTALPDGTLVVGGLAGRMLRSVDQGNSWTIVETGNTGSVTQLRAGKHGVWAASLSGHLLRSDDGAKTWHSVGKPDAPLTAIVATGDDRYLRFGKGGLADLQVR